VGWQGGNARLSAIRACEAGNMAGFDADYPKSGS